MKSELKNMLSHDNEQLIKENRMVKDKLNVIKTTYMEICKCCKPLADILADY
jgi:hypothetical protein